MRPVVPFLFISVVLGVLVAAGTAEQPKVKPVDPPKAAPRTSLADEASVNRFVARMMAFDQNKDGKLTRDEMTDERLLRMFEQADTNKDGVVTKEELIALATKLLATQAANGGSRGGFGPGGAPGEGPGGPGGRGPGGFGGPPQPGQILPAFLQDQLNLTAEQKKQVDVLQKEVDGKLGKILTEDQKKQLKEIGPGRGRPGGPGGRGPGGPPPGGEGGRPERPE